jgi:RNA polymerase sigma factor (sigma-70 family)
VNTWDDDKLLEELAAGNKMAVEFIYRENFRVIENLVIKNNGSADEARDIFQEAMIVLYENARSGSFTLSCKMKTYIYAVCRRLWLKRLQMLNRYHNGLETSDVAVDVDNEVEAYEKRNVDLDVMEEALSKMGEPCKSLIEAFYFQKRSMPEIAEQFGYTNADNAKNQKYKCLVRLKKLFFSTYKKGG